MKTTKSNKTIHLFWTHGFRPFVMGGTVNYILGCELECTGPHKLGKGYSGYLATAPNGKTIVCEAKTGAIVGDTLDDVKNDIASASVAVMRGQVKAAADQAKEVELKDAEFFWKAMKGSASQSPTEGKK